MCKINVCDVQLTMDLVACGFIFDGMVEFWFVFLFMFAYSLCVRCIKMRTHTQITNGKHYKKYEERDKNLILLFTH